MNALDVTFARLRQQGRRAFIPFLTVGDPDLALTPQRATALVDAGADLLELGFPYSDPIADGPVIQSSYTRALAQRLTLEDMFRTAASIHARHPTTPLVAMTSFSLVWRRGPQWFLQRAQEAGFSGLIVPDLPLEESAPLRGPAQSQGLHLIQLVTPTTPPQRAEQIVAASAGFVYCVSVTGITGARAELPAALIERLDWLRHVSHLPLCVGFGISTPQQVRQLRPHADGIIVGSALVRLLGDPEGFSHLAQELAQAAHEV